MRGAQTPKLRTFLPGRHHSSEALAEIRTKRFHFEFLPGGHGRPVQRAALPGLRVLEHLDDLQNSLDGGVHIDALPLGRRHQDVQTVAHVFLVLPRNAVASLASSLPPLQPFVLGHEHQHAIRTSLFHVVHPCSRPLGGGGHLLGQRSIPEGLQRRSLALQRYDRVLVLLVLRELQDCEGLEQCDGIVGGGVLGRQLRIPDDVLFRVQQNAARHRLCRTHLALDAVDPQAQRGRGNREAGREQREEDHRDGLLSELVGASRTNVVPEGGRRDEVVRAGVEERVHRHDREELQEEQRDLLRPGRVGPHLLGLRPDAGPAHRIHHFLRRAALRLRHAVFEPPGRQGLRERDAGRLLIVHVVDGPVGGVEAKNREELVLTRQRLAEVCPHLLHVVHLVFQLGHDEVQPLQLRVGSWSVVGKRRAGRRRRRLLRGADREGLSGIHGRAAHAEQRLHHGAAARGRGVHAAERPPQPPLRIRSREDVVAVGAPRGALVGEIAPGALV
eukprot:scaffold184_cov316-Pinguiococcus_pyrenoidosus.AAC.55